MTNDDPLMTTDEPLERERLALNHVAFEDCTTPLSASGCLRVPLSASECL